LTDPKWHFEEKLDMEKGKKGKEGEWVARAQLLYGLPASLSSDSLYYGLLTRTITGTCGSSGIRVLHADDANGGSCGFAQAGNTSSARNLDVDKVGAADSLLAVVVMVMVIIVVERIKIKRSRREEVDGWGSAQVGRR
jgi:hypothetical protein